MKSCLLIIAFTIMTSVIIAQPKIDVKYQITLIEKQYESMLLECRDTSLFPLSLKVDGSVRKEKSKNWCSGFFSGNLWYIYELTHDKNHAQWRQIFGNPI